MALLTDRALYCLLLMADKALRTLFTGTMQGDDSFREILYIFRILLTQEPREALRLPEPNTGKAFEEHDKAG